MLITAHGGAMETGRNSKLFFDTILQFDVDVIEVDVRKRGNLLYIAHLKELFPKKQIPLSFVFDYVVEHNLKVNCDLKERGMIKDVIELAKEKKAEKHLIFTGYLRQSDVKSIIVGDAYVNRGFYNFITPNCDNAKKIKDILDKCDNKNIKGININYRYATDDFISKAHEIGLQLSIYTIDNQDELKRIMIHKPANITTNIVDKALEFKKEII